MRRILAALIPALAMLLNSPAAQAETYRLSLAELTSTPILLEILKNIEVANPGLKFQVTVAPFPRSIRAVVEDRSADMHFPFLRPVSDSELPFDVSAAAALQSPFMIYENKNKPLDTKKLSQYKIETDMAHTGVFPFPTIGSGDIAASLRKVDAGRIDAFIFEQHNTDKQLIAGGYKNIHRKPYGMLDTCFVLPKGSKGGATDKALVKAIENAKASAAYNDYLAKIEAQNTPDGWQQ
jgi:polar amino acid transport system substrate-binding protein